ncbi:hypothetical protein FHS80_000652 [Porphyromonas circumdentaria]|nr:hypothetical protein [Porphyromonas circumdentaria]
MMIFNPHFLLITMEGWTTKAKEPQRYPLIHIE